MKEQFELFEKKEKNQPLEDKQEVLPKKTIRKPGSKEYDPKLGSYEEQDEYVQKVLGGSKANIGERVKEEYKKSREILEEKGIIEKKEKTENK